MMSISQETIQHHNMYFIILYKQHAIEQSLTKIKIMIVSCKADTTFLVQEHENKYDIKQMISQGTTILYVLHKACFLKRW